MASELRAAVANLRALLAASEAVSPGPWAARTIAGADYHDLDERIDDGQGDFTIAAMALEDAALIVALRNAAPALLAAAEAVERVRELAAELDGFGESDERLQSYDGYTDADREIFAGTARMWHDVAKRIRAALGDTDGADGGR